MKKEEQIKELLSTYYKHSTNLIANLQKVYQQYIYTAGQIQVVDNERKHIYWVSSLNFCHKTR